MDPAESNLRVCLLASDAVLREAPDWVRSLARGLADAGVAVELLASPRALKAASIGEQIPQWPWPSRAPVLRGRDLARLAARLSDPEPPLLHALSRDAGVLAGHLAAAWDTRFLLSCHRPTGDLGGRAARLLPRIAAIPAVGTRVAEAVRKRYNLPDARVPLIRQGVTVSDAVACFSRPNHVPVLVLAARGRNHDAVAAALRAVRQGVLDGLTFHTLLLCGRTPTRSLRGRIEDLELAEKVTVFGETLPLAQVLRGGDLFLQPYPQRRPSVDLLTAMACGLAPIVLDETPVGHLRNGENALLLSGSDSGAIAGSLRGAFADRRATRRLAHNAQQTVAALHRPGAEIDALLRVYAQVSRTDQHAPSD